MAKNAIPIKKGYDKPRKEAPTAAESFTPPEFTKMASNPDVVMQPPYICHCTFKEFEEQKGNFFYTQGELFSANNNYFPVSRSALEQYYRHVCDKFGGDERLALRRIAQLLNLYISDEILDYVLSASEVKNPVGRMVQRCHMKQYSDLSYIDTMVEDIQKQEAAIAEAVAEVQSTIAPDKPPEVEDIAVELFGIGLDPTEYEMLMHHYKTLTKQFDGTDAVQHALIKDLCQIKVIQQQAYIRKDMGAYADATKLYQATLKAGGLKARTEDIDMMNEDACWGTFIRDVEQYVPADIYEDEKLFNDVDETESYFKRMILRPVINFFTGSRKMDEEYSLLPGEGDDYES